MIPFHPITPSHQIITSHDPITPPPPINTTRSHSKHEPLSLKVSPLPLNSSTPPAAAAATSFSLAIVCAGDRELSCCALTPSGVMPLEEGVLVGFCRGAGTLSDTGVLVPSPRSGAMVVAVGTRRRFGAFSRAPDAVDLKCKWQF